MTKAKRPVKKSITKQPHKLILPQAPVTMQSFIAHHATMFNLTEWERLCEFPNGTMRHIAKGTRPMTWAQYESVRKNIVPLLLEAALISQNYDRRLIELEMSF